MPLPIPRATIPRTELPADRVPTEELAAQDPLDAETLTLADVVASTVRAFPQLQQVRLEAGVAAGEALAARGFYDHRLQGYTLNQPLGFYENYRHGLSLARQLWWGGYLSAGYRVGRGDFEPWYKERETNKGGEVRLSYVQPLLQGRAIDPARVALFQAALRQQAVAPDVQFALLTYTNEAAELYWSWVAMGGAVRAQEELLKQSQTRGQQFEELVRAGRSRAIDLIFNDQLIAERQLKTIETRQKFRELAIKLSMFLRDEGGQPLVPAEEWAPKRFPQLVPLPPGNFDADLAAASNRRPELLAINLDIQQVTWDIRLGENQLLPALDLVSEASQDTGPRATPLNDKGQFEVIMGLQGEVPIQRRRARGKIQASQAKLAQLQQKLRFQQDKIGAELRAARNALDQAELEVAQAEAALRAAILTLDRFNFAFQQGQTDLIYINLLESKVTEYELKLIEAQQRWFSALANMQTALGLDPIEQAIGISTLPPSEVPIPENLPDPASMENAP
jgi:outer membrane protein TolC